MNSNPSVKYLAYVSIRLQYTSLKNKNKKQIPLNLIGSCPDDVHNEARAFIYFPLIEMNAIIKRVSKHGSMLK